MSEIGCDVGKLQHRLFRDCIGGKDAIKGTVYTSSRLQQGSRHVIISMYLAKTMALKKAQTAMIRPPGIRMLQVRDLSSPIENPNLPCGVEGWGLCCHRLCAVYILTISHKPYPGVVGLVETNKNQEKHLQNQCRNT